MLQRDDSIEYGFGEVSLFFNVFLSNPLCECLYLYLHTHMHCLSLSLSLSLLVNPRTSLILMRPNECVGCGLIFAAMIMVEIVPEFTKNRPSNAKPETNQ